MQSINFEIDLNNYILNSYYMNDSTGDPVEVTKMNKECLPHRADILWASSNLLSGTLRLVVTHNKGCVKLSTPPPTLHQPGGPPTAPLHGITS